MWDILVVGLSIALGLLLKTIVHWVFSFYTKRSDYYLFKSVTKHLQAPASILIPLLTLNAALPLTQIADDPVAHKAIELAMIAGFAFLLARIVVVVEDMIYYRNDISVADNLKARKIRT